MDERLISIILPIHNQADHIGKIIQGYEKELVRLKNPYEIILVVNASKDNSLEICQALAQRYNSIRLMHSEQGGWGRAVRLGLKEARGELLCYTNSARTSPKELTLLLFYALVYPEIVIKANRNYRDTWLRRLGSLIFNLECRILLKIANWDINGTPKVFPRTCKKLLALTSNDDLVDAEFNVICQREGYRMLEVPIYSYQRLGGKTTTNFGSALKMYWGAYQLWLSLRKR